MSFAELVKDSFVDAELHEHFSDLLCEVSLRAGGGAYVYVLFEHELPRTADRVSTVALHGAGVAERTRCGSGRGYGRFCRWWCITVKPPGGCR